MSETKEYLFIAGDSKIFLTRDEDDGIVSVTVNGETFKSESDLEKFNDSETYLESENPLLKFARSRLVTFYKGQFESERENLLILSGAGTSKGIGKKVKGVLVSELWDICSDDFSDEMFKKVCATVNYDNNGGNIETLLSRIQLYLEINGNESIEVEGEEEGEDETLELKEIVSIIENKIKNKCTLELPENSPHKQLLEKITKRKNSSPRVRIFTTNYDTLFEQAANDINGVLIDGFSFTNPRTFSGRNFDYDIVRRENSRLSEDEDFVERVIHLYKLHGSVNWGRQSNNVVIGQDVDDPLMIYPRSSKYESSYEQPYFEMMSRFQANLRKSNVTLLCIGFSFNDKHIVTAIFEALNQNPSFKLIIVNPSCGDGSNATFQKLIDEIALKSNRVIIIQEKFDSFAENFPEIKTYNRSDSSKDIHVHLDTNNDGSKSV